MSFQSSMKIQLIFSRTHMCHSRYPTRHCHSDQTRMSSTLDKPGQPFNILSLANPTERQWVAAVIGHSLLLLLVISWRFWLKYPLDPRTEPSHVTFPSKTCWKRWCNTMNFQHFLLSSCPPRWQRHYSGGDAAPCRPCSSGGSRLVSAKQNMMALIFSRAVASFCQSHPATRLTVWGSKSSCPCLSSLSFSLSLPSLFWFRAPGVCFNYL